MTVEHNWNWREILGHLCDSFTDRAALVLFLPPGEKDRNVSGPDLSDTAEWPGLILCEKDLHKIMTAHGVTWEYEDLVTDTPPYGYERFYKLLRKD